MVANRNEISFKKFGNRTVVPPFLYCFLCISMRTNVTSGSFVSSVNYHFESFNPYSLIRFFEFSDKGWNITENCLIDMYRFVEGLRLGTVWSAKLYDASGYYGGGAFQGCKFRTHNPQICRNLNEEYKTKKLRFRTIYHANRTVVPFPVQVIVGKYLFELYHEEPYQNKIREVQQLICLPSKCNEADLKQVLEIYLFQKNFFVKNVTFQSLRVLEPEFNLFAEKDFYGMIILVICMKFIYVCLYLVRKIIEEMNLQEQHLRITQLGMNTIRHLIWKQSITYENMENKLVRHKNDRVLVLGSLNMEEILKKIKKIGFFPEKNLDDASTFLYFVFTMFYIYAHLTAEIGLMSNSTNLQYLKANNVILKNYAFIVDIFFLVSGCQLGNKFLKTSSNQQHLNVGEQLLHLLKMLIEKILSMTPSYTFCVFAALLLDTYFVKHVAMETPTMDSQNCSNRKLLTYLFYVDIFQPLTKRCMPWTWLMSLEVQLFTLICFILLLRGIHRGFANTILAFLFLTAVIGSTIWESYRTTSTESSPNLVSSIEDFNLVLNNFALHIQLFLIGVLFAYISSKTGPHIIVNPYAVISGWLSCILVVCFFFYGYERILQDANSISRICFSNLFHIIWPFTLFWILLTSRSQYKCYLDKICRVKLLHPHLDTLAPICIKVAPIIIRLFLFSADTPIYTSQLQIFFIAISSSIVIYSTAFVMYVLLDGPLNAALEVTLWTYA